MAGGQPLGLKTAVSEFFFEQLDSLDRSGGKRCPGEERCAAPPGDEEGGERTNPDSGPLFTNLAKRLGQTEEEVCGGCKLNGTRPGRHSPHLTQALALATHLDTLRGAGASFPYPSSFPNPYWWTCLVASQEGRNRADEARNKRLESKRKKDEEERERQEELRRSGGGRRGRR